MRPRLGARGRGAAGGGGGREIEPPWPAALAALPKT